MIWYDRLYMGEKAGKQRSSVMWDIRRKKKRNDIYVITPPSNEKNVLDIYPVTTLYQEYYEKKNLLILGIALGYGEALELVRRIVDEMYKATGKFDIKEFLETADR